MRKNILGKFEHMQHRLFCALVKRCDRIVANAMEQQGQIILLGEHGGKQLKDHLSL